MPPTSVGRRSEVLPAGVDPVAEADIRGFFDNMTMTFSWNRLGAGSRIAGAETGRPVASSGVMTDAGLQRTVAGTPQGGVISRCLPIYLHAFDQQMARAGPGVLVRLCRRLRVMCATLSGAGGPGGGQECSGVDGVGAASGQDEGRGPSEGREGFDFLGCHFRPVSRVGCGSNAASSASTCTDGRVSGR